jgi:hypothetical protein
MATGKEVAHDGEARAALRAPACVGIAGIEAEAAIAAELAQQPQKLALAAADFDDVPAAQLVALDQRTRELLVKAVECRRERLRLLVPPEYSVSLGSNAVFEMNPQPLQ